MKNLVILAAALLAFGAAAGEEKKEEEKKRQSKAPERKPVENKDDGESYDPEEYEKFSPLTLNAMHLRRLKLDIPGWNDPGKWSCIRKDTSDKPEEEKQTYIALPLKYPTDTRNWTAASYALKYHITTDPQYFFGVDLNGDGRYSGQQENFNKNPGGTYGPVAIYVKHEDGLVAPYSLLITQDPENSNQYFRFRSNIAWQGYIPDKRKRRESEEVIIVDANNNGLFNDYGVDLVKVGDKPLSPLAQLMLIKQRLYHVRVHPSGSRVWSKPYVKPSGQVDMVKNFHVPRRADLQMLLLINQAGTVVLDVAPESIRRDDAFPCQVPEGTWFISDGSLVIPREGVAHIYHGDMENLEVKQGETLAPEYGEPFSLTAEISHNITGINVDNVRIVGRAKEEYVALGNTAPKVELRFRGRPFMSGYVPIGPEGFYEAYFAEPRKKGIYKVTVTVDSDAFGDLEIEPVEIAHHPFGD